MNTPQPQAPSTSLRYPRTAATSSTRSARDVSTAGMRWASSGVRLRITPALGAGEVRKPTE